MMARVARAMPWWAKVGGKLVISGVPGARWFATHVLGLYRHGSMHDPTYSLGVFRKHFANAGAACRREGFVCLELGPGEAVSSALVARAHGASQVFLVDVAPFAAGREVTHYDATARHLAEQGFPVPGWSTPATLQDVLASCNASYLTDGLAGLRKVPTHSVDFVWSHAVLEHIRRDEVIPTLHEIHRVLRPDGVCSHVVDLKDHLGGSLHNLRFPSWFWESGRAAGAGFYTNRLRFQEYGTAFQQAHLGAEYVEIHRWGSLPVPRAALAREYREVSDADLLVSGFHVIARPIGS
jgi:SAM-dependent methyltransferase